MKNKQINQEYSEGKKDSDDDMRCCCGKLLTKQKKNGIVIKCSRCKREINIDFAEIQMEFNCIGRGKGRSRTCQKIY
ncbi:MAG: hypothetical protein K9L30_08385 [Desulfobacterales bacterium]|nr:hypothetical protein [Desulfobacterales bacterium]